MIFLLLFVRAGSEEPYEFHTAPPSSASSKGGPASNYLNDIGDKSLSKRPYVSRADLVGNEIESSLNYGSGAKVPLKYGQGTKDPQNYGSGTKGTDTHEWMVEQLKQFSEYEFVVQAFNEVGPGPLSEPVSAITLEDGQ